MHYPLRIAIVALFAVLSNHSASAADFDPKSLDETVEKALAEFEVPGAAVVVVKDDKVIYLKGFGVRAKGKSEKVTPDTVFAVASCTKAFTATAAAMLVADKKMNWDDPLRKHLPAFRLADESADRNATIRDLLSHRTGMPRHDMLWVGSARDPEDLIERFGLAKRSTSFRSTWEYTNAPFTAAGLAVGNAGQSDWPTIIKKRIFDPLEMTHSYASGAEASKAANRATPHYATLAGKIEPLEWDAIDVAQGAGCIGSTASDLGNWLRFQLAGGEFDGKRILSANALKDTHTPQMIFRPEGPFAVYFPAKVTKFFNYGLGWFVTDYRGEVCLSHGGTLSGFRAQCMMLPEKKLGVFVLANLRPSYFTESVAKTVIDTLLDKTEDWTKFHMDALFVQTAILKAVQAKREKDRKPDTKPTLDAKEYVGAYTEPAYGTARVSGEDDKLQLKWGSLTFRLEHFQYDTFTAVLVEPKATAITFDRSTLDVLFRIGKAGTVVGLEFLEQDFVRR